MSPLERLDRAFVSAWPYLYSSIALGLGLALLIAVRRCLACGYIYADFKYEFAERNRIYRDEDPIWFWFFVVLYGSMSIMLTGFGCVAWLRILNR